MTKDGPKLCPHCGKIITRRNQATCRDTLCLRLQYRANARRRRSFKLRAPDKFTQRINAYFAERGWEDRYSGKTASLESSLIRCALVDVAHLAAVPLIRPIGIRGL